MDGRGSDRCPATAEGRHSRNACSRSSSDHQRSRYPTSMAYEFHTRRCIEFEDTDAAGIVHFARFHVFMEQAEHQFLRSLGASVHMEVDGELISWPRLASSCEFFHPVRFEDQLDVCLSVRRKGNKAITYECEFFVGDEEVAKGEITSVCCVCAPGESMRAIPIPSLIGDKIEQRPDRDLES